MGRHAVVLALLIILAGCSGTPSQTAMPTQPTDTPTAGATSTRTPTAPPAELPNATPSPSPTLSPSPSPTPTPRPVLGDAPVDVYVENTVNDRDFESLVSDALMYWEANASRYAWYAPAYELTDERAEAEIVVRLVPELEECGQKHNETGFLGCAPLVTARVTTELPLTVEIVAGYDDRSTRNVLIHEFGHTLGLDHDDEPEAYMTAYSDATRLPLPNATERPVPWRTTNLTVYVDPGDRQYPQYEEQVREQIEYATGYFAAGADGTIAVNYTFRFVPDPTTADIIIRASNTENLCRGLESGACINSTFGRDPDDDGALEYVTNTTVHVEGIQRSEVGWWTARMLAYRLGITAESDLPEPLRDPTDRSSRWWE